MAVPLTTQAKRAKAIVDKMEEHRDIRERNAKARRADAVCLAMSFPSSSGDWFFR
jgi:hypothetical protein